MFTIDMLPAGRGDCLWIEYGKNKRHRVLIDGGIKSTHKTLRDRIETLDPDDRTFDLLIVSHIDLDHIAGMLELLHAPPDGLKFHDVWFNGWKHLMEADERLEDLGILGAKYGERLTTLIEKRGYKWNDAFEKGYVAIEPDQPLPRCTLKGGMTMTLLSPTLQRLRGLIDDWEEEIERAHLKPGQAGAALEELAHPEDVADEGILGDEDVDIEQLAKSAFKKDTSPANASSIAVLAEYDGKRCMLTGDAYATDLEESVKLIAEEDGEERVQVSALKLSHHGGRKNTSSALLKRLACQYYMFSTDGSYYDHPHAESVARVAVHGSTAGAPTLHFNYRSDESQLWEDDELAEGNHPYTTKYPGAGKPGLSVEL